MAELTMLKKGDRWSIWSDGRNKLIKIDKVRCSFPALGSKRENKDEKTGKVSASWQITLMLKKDTDKAIKDAFKSISDELLLTNQPDATKKAAGVGIKMEPQYKCLKDGDEKDRDEYANHYIITANDSYRQPTIRTFKGDVMTDKDEIDKKFYGGCWVSAMLRPWFFDGKAKNDASNYPKRVSCGITSVQFIRDDDPFGEGTVDDSAAWGDASSDDDGLGGGSSGGDDEL